VQKAAKDPPKVYPEVGVAMALVRHMEAMAVLLVTEQGMQAVLQKEARVP